MRRLFFRLSVFFLFVLAAGPGAVRGQDREAGEGALGVPGGGGGEGIRWYRSNSAGMALERLYSRSAALRNPYSLSVGPLSAGELAAYLRPYYTDPWRIELRVLYEDGLESRRQFLFVDSADVTRLIAVRVDPKDAAAGEDEGRQEKTGGFIELFDENRLLIEAHQFLGDGSEYITGYIYRNGVLIRAENRLRESVTEDSGERKDRLRDISTDYYRYTRSNSLRLVERVFHRAAGEEDEVSRFQFPPLSPNSPVDPEFVRPGLAYSSEFLEDIILNSVFRVIYTTDDRGRILTETRQDAAGKVLGEIRNTWSADRLTAVEWSSPEDERRTEYDYDREGNRIVERNYNKGSLERAVRREGSREVEDLYMNGILVLRAVWEDGRKISEERIRPSPPVQAETSAGGGGR